MRNLILRSFHESLGAQFFNLDDTEVVRDYGDVPGEHLGLTGTAGVMDLSFRGRVCLTGTDRARFLHGQVTNDIKALSAGDGCYAALITAKGRMQSDLNIFCLEDELLLDFEPGLSSVIIERLEKFIIADDVQVVDVSPQYGLMAVNGPRAGEVIRTLAIFSDLPAEPFRFSAVNDPNFGQLYLANHARTGTSGFDLFIPTPALETLADKLSDATRALGGKACGWEAFEIARIEAGIPRFGADMDESNIPLEAGLESTAISFNKGCYIGQEVISRIRTYGQVTKALRGLRLSDVRSLPAKGDKLVKDGKEVGYVTSAVASPRLGANIALGYVRKEVNAVGTEMTVKSAGLEIGARVVNLPFAPA